MKMKAPPKTKIIGGKRYTYADSSMSKAEMTAIVGHLHLHGYLARLVTFPDVKGYFVYQRGKAVAGVRGRRG